MGIKSVKSERKFVRYGRWDSLEHAKNGLKGTSVEVEKLAKNRLEMQKIRDMEKKNRSS